MARTGICLVCGKEFTLTNGTHYKMVGSRRRYICNSCYRQMQQEVKENKKANRIATTGMKQSTLSMILKILFGLLFIYTGITMLTDGDASTSVGSAFIGFALGAALLAWGIIPYINAKKKGF